MTAKEEIDALCNNIIALRRKNNISIEEMSKIMRISISQLEQIELGVMPAGIPLGALFCIERHFGISPSSLFIPQK